MIVDAILRMVTGLINAAVSIMPQWNISFPALPISWLADINFFVPVVELAGIAFVIVALGGPLAVASLALYGIALFRGGSSKG